MEIGMDLGAEGIAEDDGAEQTCWRSISDWYLTSDRGELAVGPVML